MEILNNSQNEFLHGWTGPVDMDNHFISLALRISAHTKSDFAQDGYVDAKLPDAFGSGDEHALHNLGTGQSNIGDFSYNEFNDSKTGEEKIIRWHTSDGRGFFVDKEKEPELFEVVKEYRDFFSIGERNLPRMNELAETFDQLTQAE